MPIVSKQLGEEWNFTLTRGDTWPAESFNVVDQQGNTITGFSVKMDIKLKREDTAVVKSLTQDDGFTVTGNNVLFNTEVDLAVGTYYYDLQITLSSNKVFTLYRGKIKVSQDITDAG